MTRLHHAVRPLALLAALALGGCGEIDRPLVVGTKDFAEQQVTAQLLAQTLRAHDIPAEVDDTARDSLGAIGALWVGEIDLYVDYTGSILALGGHPPVHEDPTSFVAAQEALAPFELDIGPLLGFSNDYVVLARPGSRAAAAPARLSALADAGQALRMGMTNEFRARPVDGFEPLTRRYGLRAEPTLLVPSSPEGKDRLYAALLDGDIDLAVGFSTDPQIAEFGLVRIADDRDFFPAYAAAPVTRQGLLARRPHLAPALASLEDRVSTEDMRRMLAEVTTLGADPFAVVARFLDPTLPPATDGTLARPFGIAVGRLDAVAGQAADVVLALRKAFPGRRIEVRRVTDPLAPLLAGEVRYALVTGPALFTLDTARGKPQRGKADALVPVGFDTLHLLIRPDADGEVWDPEARIGVGPAEGITARTAVFVESGVEPARAALVPADAEGLAAFRAQAAQVRAGELDGLLVMAETGHPLIGELLTDGLRLAAVDSWETQGNRLAFPFLQPVTIPAGTYPGQSAPLASVGSQVVLAAARSDPTDAVGVVGPGSAAIGQNLPVAAGTVARLRGALDVSVRLDPSLPTSMIAFEPPAERREGIGLSPAVSLVNLGAIVALVLIIRLYLAPPRTRPGAPEQGR
jgi:glycine betaine/choline ABC-type transport system substrate-binding protein